MKNKVLTLSVLASLSLASSLAQAAPIVNGGTVHFVGEVVNAACAVDAGSMDQTVQLGQVRTAKLATVGATSGNVGFNIVLKDCDTSVSTKAQVAFTGVADSVNAEALALDSSAAGSATGVGVQILDKAGTTLAVDGATWSAVTTLSDGTNTIPFASRYIATTAAVTPGTANAVATFKIQYE